MLSGAGDGVVLPSYSQIGASLNSLVKEVKERDRGGDQIRKRRPDKDLRALKRRL